MKIDLILIEIIRYSLKILLIPFTVLSHFGHLFVAIADLSNALYHNFMGRMEKWT